MLIGQYSIPVIVILCENLFINSQKSVRLTQKKYNEFFLDKENI